MGGRGCCDGIAFGAVGAAAAHLQIEKIKGDDDEDGHDGGVCKVLDDRVRILVHQRHRQPVEGLEEHQQHRERRVTVEEADVPAGSFDMRH